jgi:hypothetical protein
MVCPIPTVNGIEAKVMVLDVDELAAIVPVI